MTAVTTRRHVSGRRHGAPVHDNRPQSWTHLAPPRCKCSHAFVLHAADGNCQIRVCGCATYRPNTDGGNQ